MVYEPIDRFVLDVPAESLESSRLRWRGCMQFRKRRPLMVRRARSRHVPAARAGCGSSYRPYAWEGVRRRLRPLSAGQRGDPEAAARFDNNPLNGRGVPLCVARRAPQAGEAHTRLCSTVQLVSRSAGVGRNDRAHRHLAAVMSDHTSDAAAVERVVALAPRRLRTSRRRACLGVRSAWCKSSRSTTGRSSDREARQTDEPAVVVGETRQLLSPARRGRAGCRPLELVPLLAPARRCSRRFRPCRAVP
jgi:hypothetical protein